MEKQQPNSSKVNKQTAKISELQYIVENLEPALLIDDDEVIERINVKEINNPKATTQYIDIAPGLSNVMHKAAVSYRESLIKSLKKFNDKWFNT